MHALQDWVGPTKVGHGSFLHPPCGGGGGDPHERMVRMQPHHLHKLVGLLAIAPTDKVQRWPMERVHSSEARVDKKIGKNAYCLYLMRAPGDG